MRLVHYSGEAQVIEINDLSFGYRPGVPLFKELNLQLTTGHIYGLLGKNGAGKTTLMRLVGGLLFPQQGSCSISGKSASARIPAILQEIYFIPEEFYLPPKMSAAEYAKLFGAFYKRFNMKVFWKVFRAFGLPNDKKLHEYSYGLKKKFLVAFGLATNVSILLLDEPTNGLDIPGKSQFRRILASMLDKDKIFIIATHQVRDVEHLIDSLVIVDEGKMIFNHTMEEVAEKLQCKSASEVTKEEVIFSEEGMGAHRCVAANKGGVETKIDLELLFTAIISKAEAINALF